MYVVTLDAFMIEPSGFRFCKPHISGYNISKSQVGG